MRVFCGLLLLGSLSFGQNAPSASAPECGPMDAYFKVKTSEAHPAIQPDSAKAVVYFLQDDAEFLSRPRPSTRIGVDGSWVGATNANSYFYVFLAPGEHHLCASWQSSGIITVSRKTAAAHFTAEPGATYFFRARDFWVAGYGHVELQPLDSDEGQLLVREFSFSSSVPKK